MTAPACLSSERLLCSVPPADLAYPSDAQFPVCSSHPRSRTVSSFLLSVPAAPKLSVQGVATACLSVSLLSYEHLKTLAVTLGYVFLWLALSTAKMFCMPYLVTFCNTFFYVINAIRF